MAPRANWKGFLRLSLVTCPVAPFPATSDSEKISFMLLPIAGTPAKTSAKPVASRKRKTA